MYDLGGPDIYSLKDIIRLIIRSEKLTRIIIPLNRSLSYLFAFIMEMMPIKILTRDNWRSMEVDNVVNTQREISHRYSLERLEHYLSSKKSISPVRSKYDFYRTKSGR